jgi:hypothetical protein
MLSGGCPGCENVRSASQRRLSLQAAPRRARRIWPDSVGGLGATGSRSRIPPSKEPVGSLPNYLEETLHRLVDTEVDAVVVQACNRALDAIDVAQFLREIAQIVVPDLTIKDWEHAPATLFTLPDMSSHNLPFLIEDWNISDYKPLCFLVNLFCFLQTIDLLLALGYYEC